MTDFDTIEALTIQLENTGNFLRGMLFDPNIPNNVKEAIRVKVHEIDNLTINWEKEE